MKRKMLAILIFSCVCAFFAMGAFASTSLMLAHAVNTPLNYSLVFTGYTQPGDDKGEEITECTFDDGGRYLFATLYLTFNRTLMFDSLKITFTDMVNTEDSTECYPYLMEVLVPGDETNHLVEITEAANGHGAGSAMLISSATAFKRTTIGNSEDRRLADLAITLLGTEGEYSGTYVGTVTLDFVAN